MQIELWRNVKIVDTSATATKRLIKMIAVGLVTAILLATTIGHTKQMANIYNNAGNIEQGQGYAGETGELYATDRKDGKKPFVKFDTPQMGVRAIMMDMRTKIKRHKGNLLSIITEYAPPSENRTDLYYKYVKNSLNGEDMVNETMLIPLVKAIINYENKEEVANYYLKDPKIIQEAFMLSKMSFPSGTSYEEAMKIYQNSE